MVLDKHAAILPVRESGKMSTANVRKPTFQVQALTDNRKY
jgi:hypothetical protein